MLTTQNTDCTFLYFQAKGLKQDLFLAISRKMQKFTEENNYYNMMSKVSLLLCKIFSQNLLSNFC